MVVTDDIRLKTAVGPQVMPGLLVFDEKSNSNRAHRVRAANVMNKSMHPFAITCDQNLYVRFSVWFLHGCPEVSAVQGSHKRANRFSSHRIFRGAQFRAWLVLHCHARQYRFAAPIRAKS